MSRKQIYGITLTDEEKRMAGYDRASGFARTTTSAPAPKPQYAGIASHTCQVTLPDGTECRADYACYGGGGSHTFYFHSPLSEREYGNGSLADIPSIEARAQELVGRMWRKAQDAEQKTMRLPSAPSNLVHTLDKTPQLTRKTAQRFAGLFAVCLRYPTSGTLTPLAAACEKRAEALSDLARMQAQNKQTLVIGICCRWARRWQEPRFLLDAPAELNTQQAVAELTGSPMMRKEAGTNANGSRPQHEEEEEEQVWDEDEDEDEEADLDEEDPDEEPDQPDPLDNDPDEDDEEEDPDDPFEGT